MTSPRGGVGRMVAVIALSLLLPACAPAPVAPPVPAWSYVETKLSPFWWYDLVNVPGARAKGVTGANVTIAFVDTGSLRHEDLPTPTGVATCGPNPADISDRRGHGTQLAGIALGQDRGRATRGLAPAASLVAIKVDCGLVTAAALTDGIDQAIQRKPSVIVLAIGGYPAGPPDVATFMKNRVEANADILFVVASVWDGMVYQFPAWTRLPNVVVVGAMTLAGRDRTSYVEIPYDGRRGDISAPGRDIETADILPDPANPNLHTQFFMQGTSPAAAIVAGCAALVKEKTGYAGANLKAALVGAARTSRYLESGSLNCDRAVP